MFTQYDDGVVVYNKFTKEFVPFRLDANGEIQIISTNPKNTDESCIVTTWGMIYKKNLAKKGMLN